MDALIHHHALVLLLVLARVGGLFAVAPMFAATEIPVRFRLLLAGLVALTVVPLQDARELPLPAHALDAAIAAAAEMAIGATIGLGVALLLTGMQLAGQLIAQLGGLSLAQVFCADSSDASPVPAHLFYSLSLVMFLLLGGHRMTVEALLGTFESVPLGANLQAGPMLETLVALLGQSCALGLRVAAPAIAVLLVSSLAMGLVGRGAAQLSIITLGVGLNTLVALGVVTVSLGAIAWAFADHIEQLFAVMAGFPHVTQAATEYGG